MGKKTLIASLILLAAIGGLVGCKSCLFLSSVYLFGMVPGVQEAQEISSVVTFVDAHFSFAEKSKSSPEKSPIFCRPGSHGLMNSPHTLIVYTVTEKTQQDRIIDLVHQYQQEKDLRAINVEFYKNENWTTTITPGGNMSGSRGEEELIRKVKVR